MGGLVRYRVTMRFHAMLWDLDGTLVDSLSDIAASVNAARASVGLPALAEALVRTYVGDGMTKLIERALPDTHRGRFDEVVRAFAEHYERHCLDATRPFAGVPETLEQLQNAGVKLAVLTNKPYAFTRTLLEGLRLAERFSVVVGGDSAPAKKPAPEPFRMALKQLGEADDGGGRTLVVGDGQPDIAGARACGLSVCAVTWGFTPAPVLRTLKPDFLVDRPEELLSVVNGA